MFPEEGAVRISVGVKSDTDSASSCPIDAISFVLILWFKKWVTSSIKRLFAINERDWVTKEEASNFCAVLKGEAEITRSASAGGRSGRLG